MPRLKRTITEEEADDEKTEAEEAEEVRAANPGVTIFDLSGRDHQKIGKVMVHRTAPAEIAGFAGTTEATITEEDLAARFGGGEYKLVARDASNRFFKQTTIVITGDPIFTSDVQEADYRRRRGLPPKQGAPAAAPAGEALSMKDVLLMLEEREQRRRDEENTREERRRQAELELATKKAELEKEAADRRHKEDEERDVRRKKDEEEREDRRRKELRADEDRRDRQHKEDMERQAQMFQGILTLAQAKESAAGKHADPVALLVQGMDLALKLRPDNGGGGNGDGEGPPADALTTFVRGIAPRLPELLSAASQASADVRAEMAQGSAQTAQRDPNALVIKGALAKKLRAVSAQLVAQGKDPAQALDQLATMLLKRRPPKAAPAAPARLETKSVETKAEYDARTGTDRHTVPAPEAPPIIMRRAQRYTPPPPQPDSSPGEAAS